MPEGISTTGRKEGCVCMKTMSARIKGKEEDRETGSKEPDTSCRS